MNRTPQNIDAMEREEAARVFRVTGVSLDRWLKDGCPRNADGTYDLYEVHRWLIARAEGSQDKLKEQKLQEEIRKLQILNERLEDKYIERSEVEKILVGRAISLRNFFERSYQLTRKERSMRSIEELVALDQQYICEMLEAYCGSPVPEAPPVAPLTGAPPPASAPVVLDKPVPDDWLTDV